MYSESDKSKMSRQLTPVNEINQTFQKRWTATVQVLECHHILQRRNGSPYKRLLLTDSEGLKLTALIFCDHLDRFANIFRQYKRYRISNAFVICNDPKYAVSSYGYSWVLNNRTLVEECPENTPTVLPCKFQFTEFTKLHQYAESDTLQDVRGVVVQCLPSVEQGVELVTRRDIVIINEEKVPLVITLWKQFDEHEGSMLQAMKGPPTLIFGLRLKVTTFNSISLTTTANSGFLVNPPVEQELQLRKWFNNNRSEIQELLTMRNYRRSELLLPFPADENIVSILTATAHFESVKTAWITVQDRGLSYTACANCQKSLEADTTWIVICPSCRVESEIQDMSRMTVVISDGSGFLKANITTPEIEKFIPFTAEDMKIAAENGDDLCEAIAAAIESVPIIAFVRAYEVRVHGATETEMRVNIVKAYKKTDKDTNPEIIANTLSASPSVPPQKGNTSLPISKSGNKETFCQVNNTKHAPIIYLLPQTKPSPVVMKEPTVPEVNKSASPSCTQKIPEVIPCPSTPKNTKSFVHLHQSGPVSVMKKSTVPEVSKTASPSVAQKVSEVIPCPSTPKNTTSFVPLHQSIPVAVNSDITHEVNDPRPSKKNK